MLHPITFSISEEKIVSDMPLKTKIVSNLVPGNRSTYIYHTEKDYYNEYRSSYFAITRKKGGWDCMRHYEIVANGCLPYFMNIEDCPPNTLYLWPKQLTIESNQLYDEFIKKKINELTDTDIAKYNALVSRFLHYLKQHLTTRKMASYILNQSNASNAKNVLFLSSKISPDYLRCVTLHGFKTILGDKCHDYPKIPHIYKSDTLPFHRLYGKGITYTNLVDNALHNDALDASIETDIKRKYYDFVIYGSYHRGMPHYDLVCQYYNAEEIILLCGEDDHCCDSAKYVEKGHTVFVREL